jgi:plastocyanin
VAARRLLILFAIGAMLIAGCGSSSKKSSGSSGATTTTTAAARPKVTIEASEYAFVVPKSIPSGWVDVTLHNNGKEGHQIAFTKLGSMSFAAYKTAAGATNVKAFLDTSVFVGGPNNVDPGQSVTATVHLEPGEYGVACFIPAADGKPHAAHGMVADVTVAATSESTETAPTADAGTITTSEFTFGVSSGFTGKGTVAFTNVGTQVHEAIVVKEKPGKTLAEIKNFFLAQTPPPGPPPFDSAGGVVGIGHKATAYQQMNLTAGKYVLICFFPDPNKGGIPHVLEGMIKEFTVS